MMGSRTSGEGTWRTRLIAAGRRLAGSGEAPPRLATAFAAGVFLGFSPILGLQVAAMLLLGAVTRLNRLVMFAGLNLNLPWILPAYYVGMTEAGARLLGVTPPSSRMAALAELTRLSPLTSAFWSHVGTVSDGLLWPFLVGSTMGAAVLGLVAWPVGLGLVWLVRQGGGPAELAEG